MQNLHEPGDPTLVLLHATGGNERQMMEFGRTLAPSGFGLLSILGEEPERGVNRWFRRFAEGVFDEPNLVARANQLADFVLEAVPSGRRIAVGYSNGANIAAAVLLLRPDALDGACLFAPMVPLIPPTLPDLTGKPILMICGESDPIVPRPNAQALATMFQTAGADVSLQWHAGGHEFGAQERNVAAAWLARLRSS